MMKRLFIGIQIQSAKANQFAEIWENNRKLNSNKFESYYFVLFFIIIIFNSSNFLCV